MSNITEQQSDTNVSSINYTPVVWEDNVTPLNAANLNSMDNGIIESMKQCKYLNDKIDKVQTDLDSRITNLDKKVENYQKNNNERLEAAESNITTIQKDIKELKTTVTTHNTAINILQGDVSNIDDSIDDIVSRLSTLEQTGKNVWFDPRNGTVFIQ